MASAKEEERALPAVASTYKGREVEAALDVWFYRPFGFLLARGFAKLHGTPAIVTLCGGAAGVVAGHLYGYFSLTTNLAGMCLHVLSNALDNADGQLARLTNSGSRSGRALDGLVDNVVFASVYVHLCLRHVASGGSHLVWLLAVGAGISHSMQSALADYFRNGYLHFTAGQSRGELDETAALRASYEQESWRCAPGRKLLLRLYLNYTVQQETLAPSLAKLRRAAERLSPGSIPPWLAPEYRKRARPLLPLSNLLATNPRMLLLFALLFLRQPPWYFIAEVTVFNVILVVLLAQQERMCRALLAQFRSR